MDLNTVNRSPREEGELEDGEICDDETEESVPIRRGDGNRRGGGGCGAPPRTRKPHIHPHKMLPHMGHPPPDFRLLMPYNLGPHTHGPFPPSHRQQCEPSGPDRPPSPLPLPPPMPMPLPLPPGLGPHCEPSPRSSFWERSHGALGRFRHRAMPNRGRGGWNRGSRGGGNTRAPPGRYGPGESHSNKKDSPLRKQKPLGRNQARKAAHSVSKSDTSVDESFEDLLSKYKQIQLELECIRKEETMALEPKGSPERDEASDHAASIAEAKPVTETARVPSPAGAEETPEMKKVFQAFNIKPLRQKLPTPVNLDDPKRKCGEQVKSGDGEQEGEEEEERATQVGAETEQKADKEAEEAKKMCSCCSEESEDDGKEKTKKACSCRRESSASSEDSVISPDKQPVVKVEEEELSELQLRLLALQSASKKWQQKEQQVMKRSRERITKAAQEKSSSSSPTAAAAAAAASPSPTSRQVRTERVTTRSASSAAAAAAAAAERNRTKSKPQDRERDRTKTGARPGDRDRERLTDRERLKPSPKPGPKSPLERSRTAGKPHMTKKISPGSAAKQAARKQQLRTWKLQRQQEEKRRLEEDERRKREDEIRRIRDLSNQDEQYNRFMKLVGGKMQTRSKSRDREHRKSTGKTGLDASGNLYQYDNYDEVAMDTDSETSSPVPSPSHAASAADDPGCFPQTSLYVTDSAQFGMDFSQPFLSSMLSGVPPPPPPLPPPPDELEPPPKPPFADEEEEEEMLLRETCLMSMANKRVPASEEKICSGPPSPSCQPDAGDKLPTRGNLSTVSLNTVPPSRTNKFTRGHHAPRAPLLLPRHKSVVVSLNDSDDSDSDVDAGSSSQAMFGGLEFMIKEARRTVEAAKPKGASGSEKENNPVRTPEALPEAKKAEYRLLKEEIASREKQKMLKDHSLSSSSPAVSDSAVDSSARSAAELKLTEVEQGLKKHRDLLQRDEAVLRHLLQQELKKRESLRAAETKVAKLREQLTASEKIVSANKTLLNKLQEQVHRVEHRVSIKKSVAAKLEQELVKALQATGRSSKRRQDSNQTLPSKLQRVDGASLGSERHFAELIAQKQRLQQLESEYALKIQKLKEAQALRNKGVAPEPPAEPRSRASTPPDPQSQLPPASSSFPLPQPSLHDLTQDKLVLDSEDVPEAEDHESESTSAPAAAAATATAKGTRRHSFRRSDSNSFTKPNLEQLSSTPAKDSNAAKPAKTVSSSPEPAEMIAGLDMDSLKLRYQQQAQLGELLRLELQKVGEHVDNLPTGKVVAVEVDAAAGNTELRPVPFGPYHSPLLVFRSYRFSPYYRTKEKLSLSSVTYSNTIEPKKCFCRFDLTGTCNDDDCRWQHMRNCTLSGNQLFQDILSYNLSLIGCSESSSDEDISAATENYMKKLFGTNKDRMGVDQKAVLLVSKVNESKRHVPPFTTFKDTRRWRLKPSAQSNLHPEDDSEEETAGGNPTQGRYDDGSKTSLSALDVCVTSEDKRYFISETDDISNLETSVLESPRDTQLWIKLAFRYLNQNEISAAECLEAALNTLSRALESNCDNPEVWSHYLSLFSRRGSREEVQEMCEMAVEHAPDYRVWWNYLNLESSFEGKDYVCDRLLQYLLGEASSGVTEKLSFQLMEALLYRVDLNLFTGRMESALAILQNALKSALERSIADHLTPSDRALIWLSYIHLTEFDRLPCSLYDPAESGPSRLLSREHFLLPWRTPQDISTPLDILIALFQDAIHQCSDESLSQSERTLACLPLHSNLIFLNKLLERFDEGIVLCESLLEFCPESCTLRDALADLHLRKGNADQAVSMWLHALAECPNNAEVFYHSCKFLMAQDKSSAVVPLFRGFILSLCEDEQSQKKPVDVLRHILGFATEELLSGPIIRKELQEQLSQQMPYLHLLHCRWQWLHSSAEETVDAFERALGSAMPLEELHKVWMDYLEFSSSQLARSPANSESRRFSDLVQRCLSTVPSRLEVPFNPAEFWSCYRFHNKVVSLYLSCLPQSQHALVLERLRYAMPNNTELGLRLLHQEWQDGNMEHLKFQARMLTNNAPKCLANWRISIAVERELKERSEVRLLYQQALQNLPLCAALWKDLLQFESAEGGNTDRLRRLVLRCQEVGVSLVEVRAAHTEDLGLSNIPLNNNNNNNNNKLS
ncbi:zinc finger C3H1 domain-containing protein-like isoform X3 [Thunnus albacares]|uniref:zinc finger C3H1 domain-containing protein-like isoform X3 n=1 Tax=Thunnus albacares TaxID=8236 RepID=UPI001CF680A6|nr:zinc finger C3H1 domain-containing protein-like isoform X3 [Thunnus albacares]